MKRKKIENIRILFFWEIDGARKFEEVNFSFWVFVATTIIGDSLGGPQCLYLGIIMK